MRRFFLLVAFLFLSVACNNSDTNEKDVLKKQLKIQQELINEQALLKRNLDIENGFKEYKLGSNVSAYDLSNFSKIKVDTLDYIYKYADYNETINGIRINNLTLQFKETLLSKVLVEFDISQKSNFIAINNYYAELFGTPDIISKNSLQRTWKGSDIILNIEPENEISKTIYVSFESIKVNQKIEELKKSRTPRKVITFSFQEDNE